ncbi:MAG: ribonuclease H-like domain-containing protein [Candidatus Harrisonbacteria bacterium]|nr:ribonuclease H-like domain-containing protein [Candidatus Harrisonbacteria bacterium]
MDKLVIDIETKNTFADVGGQYNLGKLEASFVGVYSYNKNAYCSFFEKDFNELGRVLQKAGLVIGFSINRFDIPVMKKYYEAGNNFSTGVNFNIHALERLDLLDEIERAIGSRISLNLLAKENLGIGKTHHGLDAVKFYREGNMEELKNYCLHDVKITKDLYDLAQKQKYLLVPQRESPQPVKVALDFKEAFIPATLF